jgi:CubicO group peptidase (beta-lactamase class C family)
MTTTTLSQAGLDALHRAMEARVARGELPGIVTLVARGDDVHVDAIGAMEFGGDRPLRRDAIFRIASMTKPILAAAAMTLVEDGTLALDEPVERLLPELAGRRVLRRVDGPLDDTVPAERSITVEDLLSFRMGYGHLLVPEATPPIDPPYPVIEAARELELVMGAPEPRTPHDPDRWIERFASLPLLSQPGERWHYNAGSLVLSVLVARAAGEPLDAVLRARVLEPLGMRDTGFSMPADKTDRLPSQYSAFETGTPRLVTVSGPDVWTSRPVFPSGAGGLVSTVDDYLAFARLLLNGGRHGDERLLSEASVDAMTANRLTPDQIAGGGFLLNGQGWGLGMAVSVAPDEASPAPGRYGWAGGYGTGWFNDPNRGLIGIAMTQMSDFLWNGGLAEFTRLAARA